MYVYYLETEPPKTHNVNFLFSKITGSEAFRAANDISRFDERKNDCEDFLMDVMFYYMSDYPFSYKNITARFVDSRLANELYQKTLLFVAWLRSFLPKIDIPDAPA
jgi:HEPN domain-containing protein